jgi:hypothetical protein
VNSIFSFASSRAEPLGEPVPNAKPLRATPAVADAPAPPPNRAANATAALTQLLRYLNDNFLSGLGTASVLATSVAERPIGMGNLRGMERRSQFATVAVKGGRVEATVSFQFLAASQAAVDEAVATLQGRLLTARDTLWNVGFLRFTADETSLPEFMTDANTWRKLAQYRVLFEYHYVDADGAESIVVRIPIHSDLEEPDSPVRETTVVTDALVRWDDEGAPALTVVARDRAPVRIMGLASLAHLPAGWTGKEVTVARLRRSLATPPTTYPTFDAFAAAVTDPVNPDRHARVIFLTAEQFLAHFTPAGGAIELGDWDEDGTPDLYRPAALALNPLLQLDSADDLFQVTYADPTLDAKAVFYLYVEAHQL